MSTHDINPDVVEKFLAGEYTPEGQRPVDVAGAWKRVAANTVEARNGSLGAFVGTPGTTPARVPKGRGRRPWLYSAIGIAAAIIIVIAGIKYIPTSSKPQPQEYSTKSGERAEIKLADGTGVTLAPKTHIKYSVSKNSKDVFIDGEALFTIAHNSNVPFIVHTGNTITRVLGTSFTVRKYADDKNVQVVVAQGRVALNGSVLGSGEMGVVNALDNTAQVSVTRGVDISAALGWTEGDNPRLAFRDIPASQVFAELERWYGVDIQVADSALEQRVISVALSTAEPSESIQRVCTLLAARCDIKGRSVVIKR